MLHLTIHVTMYIDRMDNWQPTCHVLRCTYNLKLYREHPCYWDNLCMPIMCLVWETDNFKSLTKQIKVQVLILSFPELRFWLCYHKVSVRYACRLYKISSAFSPTKKFTNMAVSSSIWTLWGSRSNLKHKLATCVNLNYHYLIESIHLDAFILNFTWIWLFQLSCFYILIDVPNHQCIYNIQLTFCSSRWKYKNNCNMNMSYIWIIGPLYWCCTASDYTDL